MQVHLNTIVFNITQVRLQINISLKYKKYYVCNIVHVSKKWGYRETKHVYK